MFWLFVIFHPPGDSIQYFLHENFDKKSRLAISSKSTEVSCIHTISCQISPTFMVFYRSGLQVLPNNAKLHFNYGNYLRDSSNFELAKMHYRKALELWPSYASAWNNLGTLIEDDIDSQEKHFLAAVHFSDQHINAHFNLGQLYR